MKKIVVLILAVVMMCFLSLPVFAAAPEGTSYQVGNITVVFAEDSALTVDQQQAVAELLANPEYGVAKANLLCSLFGHKNTAEIVTAITHKAEPQSPRCKQEIFEVTTCSRCDEATILLLSTSYMTCCPED